MASKSRKSRNKKEYRVMWSRPGYPERVAGIFSTKDNEAEEIFEKDYKNNPKYGGDTLRLLRIVRKEEVEEIAVAIGKEVGED